MKHRNVYSDEYDGAEFEYQFQPVDGTQLYKREGDKLTVGYLVYDENPFNPMTEFDGQGAIYTKPSRYARDSSITDDKGWHSYLGLNEDGGLDLELDEVAERCRERMTSLGYDEEDEPSHTFLLDAWDELYAEGKLGSPLAVPVDYCGNVHGPGTTQIYTTSIDSCNAVWVPDKSCVDNMTFVPPNITTDYPNVIVDGVTTKCESYEEWWAAIKAATPEGWKPTYADKMRAAYKYAEAVLNEYRNWCNGEVYGCVVETYTLTDSDRWKQESEDSCWGFIGYDYAKESLKSDYFVE